MKSFLSPLIVLGAMSLPSKVRGATYSTTFSAPLYFATSQLAGQDGWTINDPTPDLFSATWNGSSSGGLGGYIDAPASTHVGLSHPYGGTLAGAAFAVDFALVSSTAQHPGADSFGYSSSMPRITRSCVSPSRPIPARPRASKSFVRMGQTRRHPPTWIYFMIRSTRWI